MIKNDDGIPGLMILLSDALAKSKSAFNFDNEPRARVETPIPPAPSEAALLRVQEENVQKLPAAVHVSSTKHLKLPSGNVQELILRALQQLPEFPERGVTVTVYGFRPWNAMLNIGPGAISSNKATVMRKALVEIVFELREQVEIDIDQGN